MKKIGLNLLALSLITLLTLESCSKSEMFDQQKFTFNIQATANGKVVQVDEVHDIANDDFKFKIFKFYVSNVVLKAGNESDTLKNVALIDLAKSETWSFSKQLARKKYTQIEFLLGLDSQVNKTDPTDVEAESPLHSITGMHWSWATLYRFALIEGKYGEKGQALSEDFAWHTGKAPLLRKVSFAIPSKYYSQKEVNLNFNLNLNNLTKNLSLPEEKITHTTPQNINIAHKIADNIQSNVFLTNN